MHIEWHVYVAYSDVYQYSLFVKRWRTGSTGLVNNMPSFAHNIEPGKADTGAELLLLQVQK